MEVDPLASHPPPRPRANTGSRQPPGRKLSNKGQNPLRGNGLREGRFRKSPPRPLGKEPESTFKTKARLSPGAGPKPLLPVSERRSGEDGKAGKTRKDAEGEKWDITPDGGSAGREGRHFTVANVGNNGKIYLRPTVRPANQRYPQPNFVFPITPPSTAGLDALMSAKEKAEEESQDARELLGSQWTPMTAPSTPGGTYKPTAVQNTPTRPTRRRRAVSDSTIQDVSLGHDSDTGGFKVVISKPQEEPRSRTTEDIGSKLMPLLQVTIPSWKLGTPRFSMRGTPIIRGSSYAPTEEVRTSNLSLFSKTPRAELNSLHPSLYTLKAGSQSPHVNFPSPTLLSPLSARFPPATRATYLSTHLVIESAMFDALTFKPGCDDRSIVRYSSATHAVTAATPPRLVAEITSPSFLDYELLSDFFLTFRSFLETADLLRMLIARLKWALLRDDEVGTVVRVRTFVAIRHWILNYFVDDFVVDHRLRVTFCSLLNEFVDELSQATPGRKVQFKILAELKKCWRRVCAQYWDGPEFDSNLGMEDPIAPGGIAGHRNPSLDPSFWESDFSEVPQLEGFDLPEGDIRTDTSFLMDVDNAGHIDSILQTLEQPQERPRTPKGRTAPVFDRKHQASPTSIASLDVISCSFPTKGMRAADPTASYGLAAHPVDPSSIYTNADPIASTPRALTGKRVRAQPTHKRNNSLTDSLRDHATEKVIYKNAEFLLTLPYAGSLVRGNLLPPGQAFVDVVPPSSAGAASRQTTVFHPYPAEGQKDKAFPSAMSGPGMRKLLSSVRRALSNRGQGVSPTQGSFLNIAPLGPRGVTTNRIPGTAIVPQARPMRPSGLRTAIRIDILGAEIAEDFKKAVREDAAAEASAANNDAPTQLAGENIEYSAAYLDSSFELPKLDDERDFRPFSVTGITTGSKSIVIVDDTFPPDFPAMTGALPHNLAASNASVEAFADSFIPSGADPTPPNTPPGHAVGGTPRRSSYILSQHVISPTLSMDPLPPFVPDLATLGLGRPSEDTGTRPSFDRPSLDFIRPSPSRPPLAGFRHRRQQSSRSFRSNRSLAHRRWASFQSAIPPSTIRSFDATTYSGEGSVASEIMPPPLRVLRRRPGGDLRGAENVTDLDALPLHKSRSVGSLTTYSESFRSSYLRSPHRDSGGYVDVVSSDYSRDRADVFSLGAVAEKAPNRPLSLFSTHSSKPVMRPSFEAEAQKLAQIPDDADDDGGIASALAKLEGTWEKRSIRLSMEPRNEPQPDHASVGNGSFAGPPAERVTPEKEKRKHRHQQVVDDNVSALIASLGDVPTRSSSKLQVPENTDVTSFLSEGSRESYNSIPLLERGLTDGARSETNTHAWTNQSILQDDEDDAADEAQTAGSIDPSFELVTKTESMDKIQPGETQPELSEVQSFLDVDSDDDSDLSSELSLEVINSDDLNARPSGHAKRPASIITGPPNDMDAEAHRSSEDRPPSPPMTLVQALAMSPKSAKVPSLHDYQIWGQKPLPPTPDTTPTAAAMYAQYLQSPDDPTGTREALRDAPKFPDELNHKTSAHLPFILAFDSDILAQQFTLIEKDALNEVDWKELIDMRWKNSHSDSRSWVEFLRNSDARGVEVIVARFNIMVKWAISEIVLTQELEERARCIIKFLHIAAHCRRYRNFATMSQIAIALTSNEVARLTRTWALLPAQDIKTMQDLESLVSPTKNFYNIRAEMEGGATATDTGCIPFVGIYTHDLLFNAQRPSEIASSPTTAPLVNFERCRIAAAVVKTLLRLLEASTLYQFQPIEGITERCLWMSALSDDEIRRHSESLEPAIIQ